MDYIIDFLLYTFVKSSEKNISEGDRTKLKKNLLKFLLFLTVIILVFVYISLT